MDFFIVFFAKYFGYVLLGILFIWLLSPYGRSPEGGKDWKKHVFLVLQMAAAVMLSRGIITEATRFFWQRSRPFVEQNIAPLVEHSSSASFPSGHASFYFAIGTVLYLYNKKAGILFLLGSAVIGIARVAAGLHWPSDVIFGAIIGVASGVLVTKLSRRFLK